MIHILRRLTRRARADDGSVTIEFLLMTPLLAFAAMAMLVYFDAQRSQSLDLKAGLTVADMISRERDPVNDTYIDGAYELQKLVNLHDKSPDLRVTLVRYHTRDDTDGSTEVDPHFHVVWSETRGSKFAELTDADMKHYTARLPVMADEDRLIVVETEIDYEEPLGVGLSTAKFNSFTFAGPRHIRVCFNNTPSDPSQDNC